MRIACEKCNAVYSIAEKIIGPTGRIVKCAKCSHSWMVKPINDLLEQSLPKTKNANHLKIIAALLTIAIVIIVFIFFSKDLVKYKALRPIYEIFSVHDLDNIKLMDFTFKTEDTDIIIDGIITNNSKEDKKMPDILYLLLDKNKELVYSFTAIPTQNIIKSGEKLSIHLKINNIRKPVRYLQIDIANKSELLLGS